MHTLCNYGVSNRGVTGAIVMTGRTRSFTANLMVADSPHLMPMSEGLDTFDKLWKLGMYLFYNLYLAISVVSEQYSTPDLTSLKA